MHNHLQTVCSILLGALFLVGFSLSHAAENCTMQADGCLYQSESMLRLFNLIKDKNSEDVVNQQHNQLSGWIKKVDSDNDKFGLPFYVIEISDSFLAKDDKSSSGHAVNSQHDLDFMCMTAIYRGVKNITVGNKVHFSTYLVNFGPPLEMFSRSKNQSSRYTRHVIGACKFE